MVDTVNTGFDFVYLYRALITHFGLSIQSACPHYLKPIVLGDTDYLATADWCKCVTFVGFANISDYSLLSDFATGKIIQILILKCDSHVVCS